MQDFSWELPTLTTLNKWKNVKKFIVMHKGARAYCIQEFFSSVEKYWCLAASLLKLATRASVIQKYTLGGNCIFMHILGKNNFHRWKQGRPRQNISKSTLAESRNLIFAQILNLTFWQVSTFLKATPPSQTLMQFCDDIFQISRRLHYSKIFYLFSHNTENLR